jgi:hypothetical protein
MINAYKFVVAEPERRNHLGDLDVDVGMIFNWSSTGSTTKMRNKRREIRRNTKHKKCSSEVLLVCHIIVFHYPVALLDHFTHLFSSLIKLLHVSAILGYPKTTVHLLKLLHCISSSVKIFQCYSTFLMHSLKYFCLRTSRFIFTCAIFFLRRPCFL